MFSLHLYIIICTLYHSTYQCTSVFNKGSTNRETSSTFYFFKSQLSHPIQFNHLFIFVLPCREITKWYYSFENDLGMSPSRS